MYINNAIKRETNAIDKFERSILSKKSGTNNFMMPPKKAIGRVPIKIDLDNFSCKKNLKRFFEDCFFNLKISFLK